MYFLNVLGVYFFLYLYIQIDMNIIGISIDFYPPF